MFPLAYQVFVSRSDGILFACLFVCYNLKQNEAQSARTDSVHKGVNQRSKDVTQTQQERSESPVIALTWHANEYKVRKLHQRYILRGWLCLCDVFRALINSLVC